VSNSKKLAEYDVLFLTCAPGGQELRDVLQTYVSNGGILYASDWRYEAVAAAFPDMVGGAIVDKGAGGDISVEVADKDLQKEIGTNVTLKFKLNDWKTSAFAGPRVTTLLKGKYRKANNAGQTFEAPLMVKFKFGKGTVIFTSFHHEEDNSDIETKLLKYLIFRLVTANVDNEVNDDLSKKGFTPQRSNLFSTPIDNPTITEKYEHNTEGTLRFALGFRKEGAKLRLNIKSPDSPPKEYTWEGDSTVSVEVPNARTGTWTYTVTALHLPYENFPFTVTVGAKK